MFRECAIDVTNSKVELELDKNENCVKKKCLIVNDFEKEKQRAF